MLEGAKTGCSEPYLLRLLRSSPKNFQKIKKAQNQELEKKLNEVNQE